MNDAFLCQRTLCLPEDFLLTLISARWHHQYHQLFDHLQDLSHLHCCIPKLLSHNPRGLRKLFYRLSHTSKPKALPFFQVVLDLLYSLNPEGTWLQAIGMDFLLTEVNIFVLLTKWFSERPEIKEWLLKLATASQPKRASRLSIAEWYIWPTQVTPVMVIPQKDSRRMNLIVPYLPSILSCNLWG